MIRPTWIFNQWSLTWHQVFPKVMERQFSNDQSHSRGFKVLKIQLCSVLIVKHWPGKLIQTCLAPFTI